MYPGLVLGGSSPVPDHLDVSSYWDTTMVDETSDLAAARKRIGAALEGFIEVASKENWEEPVTWHGGVRIPVYSLASILINEYLVHGRDIATAANEHWEIGRAEAVAIFEGHLPILPHYVNEEAVANLRASYRIDIRGGRTVYITVDRGSLSISTEAPMKVDCRISADPVSYLLVGYGRVGQWKPILTGKIVAYGRKPWLGLTFAKLFHSV